MPPGAEHCLHISRVRTTTFLDSNSTPPVTQVRTTSSGQSANCRALVLQYRTAGFGAKSTLPGLVRHHARVVGVEPSDQTDERIEDKEAGFVARDGAVEAAEMNLR